MVKFTFIGSVDSGKSTIGGQLLAKVGLLDSRALDKIFGQAEEDKMGKWKWARILDVCDEEAKRGKTHEYSVTEFDYNNTHYELVDTPGHQIYIRSMISGVFGVRVACLVIPMINNEYNSCFKGTLKEHLIIAKASGIERLIILANKMDLINWDQEDYNTKCKKVVTLLNRIGYKNDDIALIPISGWLGLGITDTTGLPEWYKGRSMLEEIDRMHNSLITPSLEPSTTGTSCLTGQRFIMDTKIIDYPSIITLDFECVMHIGGKEYNTKLMGIKTTDKFIKSGTRCPTLWEFTKSVELESDRVLMRKDGATIGYSKIIKVV